MYYYYLLQLSFHSVAIFLTLVTNKNKYIQTKRYKDTVQKTQNTINASTHITKSPTQLSIPTHITNPTHTHIHKLQNPHIHISTHYKSHTYTIHTLQNPHIHTSTHCKSHTYTHPHITNPTHTHIHKL